MRLCYIKEYVAPAEGEIEDLLEHLDAHVKAQDWSVQPFS